MPVKSSSAAGRRTTLRAGMALRVHRLAVQLFYPIKHGINGTAGARVVPGLVDFRLDLPRALGGARLIVLQQPQPGADNLARVLVTTMRDLLLDELLKMLAKVNTGHDSPCDQRIDNSC